MKYSIPLGHESLLLLYYSHNILKIYFKHRDGSSSSSDDGDDAQDDEKKEVEDADEEEEEEEEAEEADEARPRKKKPRLQTYEYMESGEDLPDSLRQVDFVAARFFPEIRGYTKFYMEGGRVENNEGLIRFSTEP